MLNDSGLSTVIGNMVHIVSTHTRSDTSGIHVKLRSKKLLHMSAQSSILGVLWLHLLTTRQFTIPSCAHERLKLLSTL